MQHREFLDCVAEMIEVPAGTLTGQERLDELEGWTSVAMVSFIGFGDEHFRKTLSPRQFTTCETINDLGQLVGITA
jgi:acyl carrier protein